MKKITIYLLSFFLGMVVGLLTKGNTMDFWYGITVGVIFGGALGIFIIAILSNSKRVDKIIEHEITKRNLDVTMKDLCSIKGISYARAGYIKQFLLSRNYRLQDEVYEVKDV